MVEHSHIHTRVRCSRMPRLWPAYQQYLQTWACSARRRHRSQKNIELKASSFTNFKLTSGFIECPQSVPKKDPTPVARFSAQPKTAATDGTKLPGLPFSSPQQPTQGTSPRCTLRSWPSLGENHHPCDPTESTDGPFGFLWEDPQACPCQTVKPNGGGHQTDLSAMLFPPLIQGTCQHVLSWRLLRSVNATDSTMIKNASDVPCVNAQKLHQIHFLPLLPKALVVRVGAIRDPHRREANHPPEGGQNVPRTTVGSGRFGRSDG